MRFTVAILGLFMSLAANGEMYGWEYETFKKAEPNELAYYAYSESDCPLTTKEIESIVEGVMIRSRIKPLRTPAWLSADLYLSVSLQCLRLNNANPAFYITTSFGRYNPKPPRVYEKPFNILGVGTDEYMADALKESTEKAITDYLKVNFDLGD